MRKLPKPLLVIEDAHVHVEKVVDYFLGQMDMGDHMVIEDADNKMRDICVGVKNGQIMQGTKFTRLYGDVLSSIGRAVLVKLCGVDAPGGAI